MVQLAVIVRTDELEDAAQRLARVGFSSVERLAMDAVNEVADRTFDESVSRMTSRVNLTPAYVRDRMSVEKAKDPKKAEALIIAFRDGGRKRVRPINLRQYAPVQQKAPNEWSNAGVNRLSGLRIPVSDESARSKFTMRPGGAKLPWLANPRKPGGMLPFLPRIGAAGLGISRGMKQSGISVEVLKGERKTITYAFVAKANNSGTLVFKRDKGDTKGKGKLRPLYSLTVWQMFRTTSAQIIPLVQDDLTKTVNAALDGELRKIV